MIGVTAVSQREPIDAMAKKPSQEAEELLGDVGSSRCCPRGDEPEGEKLIHLLSGLSPVVGVFSSPRVRGGEELRGSALNERRLLKTRTTTASVGRRGAMFVLLSMLVLSAYLMALALASATLSWLGWLTLLPLLRAIQVLRPQQSMGCGALWGSCLFLFGVTAVDTSITPTLQSFLLLATIPAAYAMFGSRITRRVGFSPLVLGVGWVLAEFALRPLTLEHGLLASTQGNGALVQVVGGLFGYVIVAFVVAYASAWLLTILCDVRLGPGRPRRTAGGSDSRDLLWHVIEAFRPRVVVAISRPRGPPARLNS